MELAIVDSENAEVTMRIMRRQIRALKKDLEKQAFSHARTGQVHQVFDYWREVCRHPKAKLGVKRHKAIADRIDDGYCFEDFKLACDGAAHDHFVNQRGVHFDDIDLICRDEVKFEAFRAKGQLARNEPEPVEFGSVEHWQDVAMRSGDLASQLLEQVNHLKARIALLESLTPGAAWSPTQIFNETHPMVFKEAA